jgi:hypothetical protein
MALAAKQENNFVQLGRLLRKLQDKDKELFKQLIEEAGLQKRVAYYLVEVARRFEGVPISDAELTAIGWTKAIIIGPHVTTKNCRKLMALAQKHSAHDLQTIMEGGTPIPDARRVTLSLKPTQFERFSKAILAHGGKLVNGGLKNKERALMNLIAAVEKAAP